MPRKSKIKIRRSDELLAIDEEMDRAVDHLNEVNGGVRELLGTIQPEPEPDEENPDEAANEAPPRTDEGPPAEESENGPPANV